jgi:TonB family protein
MTIHGVATVDWPLDPNRPSAVDNPCNRQWPIDNRELLVKEVNPQYTEDAMRRKVEGIVEMFAVVLADGTVGDVTVTRSLDEDLDRQAIRATKQWEFKPGTKDGKPVAVAVNIELTFTLKERSAP